MTASRAEADLARLQADIGRLRAQLAEAEERATKVRHYIEMARVYEAGGDVPHAPVGVPTVERPRGGAASYIAGITREVLRERGGPMQTRALVDVLAKRGVTLGSKNPISYLSGVLSRAEDFGNDRVAGWYLKAGRTGLGLEMPLTPEAEQHGQKVIPPEPFDGSPADEPPEGETDESESSRQAAVT